MNEYDVTIRPMTPADIPAGMRLKDLAGWNQTENDWRLFLDMSPDGCFVAEKGGQVVGMITTADYGGVVAWIGMMLVDPDHRRRGIATRLMSRAVEHLERCATVKLDATPLGRTVYGRLGFRDEYTLKRMTGSPAGLSCAACRDTAPLTGDFLSSVTAWDEELFGADRSGVIRFLAREYPAAALVLVREDSLRGYCLGRPGTRHFQIGPVAASSSEDAVALVSGALNGIDAGRIVVDVPCSQTAFIAWLADAGFVEERPFIRMYRGPNASPGVPERIFAICGPEFG